MNQGYAILNLYEDTFGTGGQMSDSRFSQFVEIECCGEKNLEQKACISCECMSDTIFWTPEEAGPFCGECLDALCDPDQAIVLENRLAAYEKQFPELIVP